MEAVNESTVGNENVNINVDNVFIGGVLPTNSFGLNGLFKGDIPFVLKNLSYIEMSMISIYNPVTKVKVEGFLILCTFLYLYIIKILYIYIYI